MRALLVIVSALLLSACAAGSYVPATSCSSDPGGKDCQVDRYMNAP